MRFFIIPLGLISRTLRHCATRILGEDEARCLESDVDQPISAFIDELYQDTVGDAKKRILRER